MAKTLAIDDLWGQAREGWRIGEALCAGCGAYHRMRGIVRAVRLVGGARTDADALPAMLNATLAPGARVLIAGAGDPGLLAFLHENVRARPLTVRVADLCPSPLALIDMLAPMSGLAVSTQVCDLLTLPDQPAHDLILCHSLLPFIAPADRPTLLARLRGALARDGRLLIAVPVVTPGSAAARDRFFTERTLELRARLLASPEARAIMGDSLDDAVRQFSEDRSDRTAAFTDARDIRDLIESAGLRIEQHLQGGESQSAVTTAFGRLNNLFLAARA